jgi:hypothetical protein
MPASDLKVFKDKFIPIKLQQDDRVRNFAEKRN